MRYLLDTEVWLWMQAHPDRLGPAALAEISNDRNELCLSAASSLEIAMKARLGRIHLPDIPSIYVPERMRRNGVDGVPIDHSHVLASARVDERITDPVDRILLAQADGELLPIITSDPHLVGNGVDIIDARV